MTDIKTKLLWYNQRDGYGIVKDEVGNEYYIDSSVLQFEPSLLSTHEGRGVSRVGLGLLVDLNQNIQDCRCGKNVRLHKD